MKQFLALAGSGHSSMVYGSDGYCGYFSDLIKMLCKPHADLVEIRYVDTERAWYDGGEEDEIAQLICNADMNGFHGMSLSDFKAIWNSEYAEKDGSLFV